MDLTGAGTSIWPCWGPSAPVPSGLPTHHIASAFCIELRERMWKGNQSVLRSHFCSSVPSCVRIPPEHTQYSCYSALGKKAYALGRLLSSGRSPYLILRLRCQLDIFLLCLLPIWKEVNMKKCCVVETLIFRRKQYCSYQK